MGMYAFKGIWKSMQMVQIRCLSQNITKCICKIPLKAAFCHFGTSLQAISAQSLSFEQRQIEGQSCWQNWPFCVLYNFAVGLKT